jgi:M6 family metalloprotease-like protein
MRGGTLKERRMIMDNSKQLQGNILYFLMLGTVLCIGVCLATVSTVWGLGHASPGEAEQLQAEGKFESSLQRALALGNHKVSPVLVDKFRTKIKNLILKSEGVPDFFPYSILATLPPGRTGGLPSIGNPKIFVLLLDFPDHPHVNGATDIDDTLFGDGDSTEFPQESLTEYYKRSSRGLLDLGDGSTLGWYTSASNRSDIPLTDAGREDLIKTALNYYDSIGHDFSQYDNDGDGDIEYFIVYWAGPHTGWATFWWQYNAGWTDGGYTLDGKTLGNYTWQPETLNPKVAVHETGHSLGLPDLYDYDNTVGPGTGVGGFDPMDSYLADLNCFWKWMLDWLTPTVVSGGFQGLALDDSFSSNECVLIWPGVGLGNIFSEFFLVENRQAVGNDSNLWFTPDGLAIWHVDATLDLTGTNFNYNNSTTDHKLVRLMEADGLEEIEGTDCCTGCYCKAADAGDLYNMGDTIGPETAPSSDKYDGSDSCIRVWDISDLGAVPGDEMLASFSTICNHPPICDANGPYTAECEGTTTDLSLDGTGCSDPDGDAFTYAWSSNCPGGIFDDTTGATPLLTVNSSGCSVICEVNLTVTDSVGDPSYCSSSVTVNDTEAPLITCPSDRTIECDEPTDPSHTGDAAADDVCETNAPEITFDDTITPGACPQEYTITRTWRAADSCGNSRSCTQTIEVVDTTPPAIDSIAAAPNKLWAPSHKMVTVTVNVAASDNCGTPVCTITSVTSNEDENGLGDGNTSPDWKITGDLTLELRAERSGKENSRIYTINGTCSDECGNSSSGTVDVIVPHDKRK